MKTVMISIFLFFVMLFFAQASTPVEPYDDKNAAEQNEHITEFIASGLNANGVVYDEETSAVAIIQPADNVKLSGQFTGSVGVSADSKITDSTGAVFKMTSGTLRVENGVVVSMTDATVKDSTIDGRTVSGEGVDYDGSSLSTDKEMTIDGTNYAGSVSVASTDEGTLVSGTGDIMAYKKGEYVVVGDDAKFLITDSVTTCANSPTPCMNFDTVTGVLSIDGPQDDNLNIAYDTTKYAPEIFDTHQLISKAREFGKTVIGLFGYAGKNLNKYLGRIDSSGYSSKGPMDTDITIKTKEREYHVNGETGTAEVNGKKTVTQTEDIPTFEDNIYNLGSDANRGFKAIWNKKEDTINDLDNAGDITPIKKTDES